MADAVSKLDDLQKLRRFLHFGNENGLYKAGGGEFQPSLDADKARIVHELLAAERGEELVEEISKFLTCNSLGTSRSPALFALAVCARHKDQAHKTKQAAMKVFATTCNCTADLFTFVTYANSVTDTRKGWGRAMKTGVQRWFDSRDSMTLAKTITQQKTGCHWSYIDLLRVSHIAPKTEGGKMIAKYLVKGLKAVKEDFGGEKTTSDMQAALTYLDAVERLKSLTDEEVARETVEQHQLQLQQVVARLQKIPQVLVALTKQMSLREVLDNISRLAGSRVLEPEFSQASDIAGRISDPQTVQDECISPISVLVAMRVYENGSAAMKWTRNNLVVDALNSAFLTALKNNVKTTNKRYLLAVNVNQQFMSCWVHGTRVLSPVIAASGLALVLAHTEQEPMLAFFDSEVRPLTLTDTMQMPEICQTIHDQAAKPEGARSVVDMGSPLLWAEKNKKAFDVIIIMTDFRHPRAFSDFPAAFRQYRQTVGLPNAKVIMCGLTANHVQLASSEEPGMLDIAGFDATVPSVIHSFVTDTL